MICERKTLTTIGLVVLTVLLVTEPSFASFESSLIGIQTKLSNVVLPTLATIGLLFAGFSFMSGNPNARQHIIYAVIGCILGFGAQAIVDFISSSVR
ncbi:MAG: TrbC/VirB2 family protein [Deltaproteobacteria bacterium]|nr:TrbC/VirB2 family protein [Deltaproteobacteria bacterium]